MWKQFAEDASCFFFCVALEQIKEKEYALPWALDGREKVLIGVNFSTKTRRPDGWVIERGDGTIEKVGQKSVRNQSQSYVKNYDKNYDKNYVKNPCYNTR